MTPTLILLLLLVSMQAMVRPCVAFAVAFQPTEMHVSTTFDYKMRNAIIPSGAIRPKISSCTLLRASAVEEDIKGTVATIHVPETGQSIDLIGTAHLSKKSSEQVKRWIENNQPDVVMVELDPDRLYRIGIDDLSNIQLEVSSAGDIELPPEFESVDGDSNLNAIERMFVRPVMDGVQDIVLEVFAQFARKLMNNLYNDMGETMNSQAGDEFLVAIRAAENCTKCNKLVLGDRSSVTTIKRAAQLAIKNGDPLGVLGRLTEVNGKEMSKLERKVRDRLQKEKGDVEESEVQVTMMETLKEDSTIRENIFRQLEQDVPEFTQALVSERDYIMSESIRRELKPGVQKVVGVVGLGHLPGMEKRLTEMVADTNKR